MTFLNILFMIISVLIILLSLLQSSETDRGISAMGQKYQLGSGVGVAERKERGPEVVISRITMVLAVLFFTLAIIIHFFLVK